MRVLQIGNGHFDSFFLKELCLDMTKKGFEVTLFNCSDFQLKNESKIKNISGTSCFLKLKEEALKSDLIHVHYPLPQLEFFLLGISNEIPMVMTYRTSHVRDGIYRLINDSFLKKILNRVQKIFIPNEKIFEQDELIQTFMSKCVIVPPTIYEENFLPNDINLNWAKGYRRAHGNYAFFPWLKMNKRDWRHLLPYLSTIDKKVLISGKFFNQKAIEEDLQRYGLEEKVFCIGEATERGQFPGLILGSEFVCLPFYLGAQHIESMELASMIGKKPIVIGLNKADIYLKEKNVILFEQGNLMEFADICNRLFIDTQYRMVFGDLGEHSYSLRPKWNDILDLIGEYYRYSLEVQTLSNKHRAI